MEYETAIDCGSVPARRQAVLNAFIFLVRGLFLCRATRSKVDKMLKSLHKKKKKKKKKQVTEA